MPLLIPAAGKDHALNLFEHFVHVFFRAGISDAQKAQIDQHMSWLRRQSGSLIVDAKLETDPATAATGLAVILTFSPGGKLSS